MRSSDALSTAPVGWRDVGEVLAFATEAFRPGDRVVRPVAEPQVEVELGREPA